MREVDKFHTKITDYGSDTLIWEGSESSDATKDMRTLSQISILYNQLVFYAMLLDCKPKVFISTLCSCKAECFSCTCVSSKENVNETPSIS